MTVSVNPSKYSKTYWDTFPSLDLKIGSDQNKVI